MLATLVVLLAMQAPPSAPAASTGAAAIRPVGAMDQDYTIGVGDVLRITVYGHNDLSQTVVVQPGGTVVFPLIGAVPAAGQTPAELEMRIGRTLAKGLIRDPQVTVVVQEYRSQAVFVVGEVTKPGTYPLAGTTTVVEILARAGPLSPNAGSEVVIVRPPQKVDRPVLPNEVMGCGKANPGMAAGTEVWRVNLRDIRAGQLDKNIALRANDTIFVPEVTRIFVSGEVRNPGAFAFYPGLTVRQAISLAGGFTEDASTGGARVVRETGAQPKTIKMKLDERLEAGDTVVVKAKLF